MNLLRIDLDIPRKDIAINQIKERMAYFHDVGLMYSDLIAKIILIKKTSYGAKIYLKQNFKSEKDIILFQLLYGSDVYKEANTILNHFKFKMEYSNRLFDCKRYKGGKIKIAKKIDITEKVLKYVNSRKRKKSFS